MKDDLKPWLITLAIVTGVMLLVVSLVLGLLIAYQSGLADSQARIRTLETKIELALGARDTAQRAVTIAENAAVRAAGAVSEVQEWWRIDSKNLLGDFQRQLEETEDARASPGTDPAEP